MRKKVKLAFIEKDSARKTTFRKRQKGLWKKMTELTTLCEIEAGAIIYNPYDSQPEIWPSPPGVQRVISQFKTVPETEQSKRMLNQESFLQQRISKVNEQLKNQIKENREEEVTQVMFQSLAGKSMNKLNHLDLNDLQSLIDQNVMEIINKIETLRVNPHAGVSVGVAVPGAESSVAGDSDEESVGLGGRMLRGHCRR